ncbi:ATP-binding cassette domain-containing protein [Streptomyces prunicolor]|uniref:ABC transporter ATP-binding protein n=1 Tax=Streptomyces prunicolor TaxID=67348 RepID=UPI003870D5F3|nr:ATP-binding cassette domain-containing protein [Streptomyces prunicolor]
MSLVLETRNIHAGYGDVTVVRDLNLSVASGEIVALLGRNGAGKTTALLTLAGALRPLSGDLDFLGAPDRSSLAARARRGLGLMTDDRSIFFGLTVRENLRLARGSDDVMSLFPELERLLDRPAGLLSGGEQQMLGLASVLAREPKLLLIDELSFGLAPRIVQRLMTAVRQAADRGTAVILVEQFARLALDVADRAYVLVNGRVSDEGTTDELRANIAELEGKYLGVD